MKDLNASSSSSTSSTSSSSSSSPSSFSPSSSLNVTNTISSAAYRSFEESAKTKKAKYLIGLLYLCLVIFLWVGSSLLIQAIFSEEQFQSPFFLTYFSTSLFILYLFFFLFTFRRKRLKKKYERIIDVNDLASDDYTNEDIDFGDEPITTNESSLFSSSSFPTPSSTASFPFSCCYLLSSSSSSTSPLSFSQIAILALLLSPVWFLMEYLYNLSLSLTSVASNTILSTTSSIFVLIFSTLLLQVKITFTNIIGVLLTLSGACLVAFTDENSSSVSSSSSAASSSYFSDITSTSFSNTFFPLDLNQSSSSSSSSTGPFIPSISTHHSWQGDLIAFISAVCYGFYTVLVRLWVKDDNQVNWELLFGLLGLYNCIFLWPLFFIFDVAKLEEFQLPNKVVLLSLLLNGLLGTVAADYLWARSIVLTSPLVATMALTLNIPVAMIADSIINGNSYSWQYVFGGMLVVAGFIAVNWKLGQDINLEEETSKGIQSSDIDAETVCISRDANEDISNDSSETDNEET